VARVARLVGAEADWTLQTCEYSYMSLIWLEMKAAYRNVVWNVFAPAALPARPDSCPNLTGGISHSMLRQIMLIYLLLLQLYWRYDKFPPKQQ
jgi:hypothetical protein